MHVYVLRSELIAKPADARPEEYVDNRLVTLENDAQALAYYTRYVAENDPGCRYTLLRLKTKDITPVL